MKKSKQLRTHVYITYACMQHIRLILNANFIGETMEILTLSIGRSANKISFLKMLTKAEIYTK